MFQLNSLWSRVKRNPVINAFLLAIAAQFFQDLEAGAIDWQHLLGYFATLCFGVMAREFTVPEKEHRQSVEALGSANRELIRKLNWKETNVDK